MNIERGPENSLPRETPTNKQEMWVAKMNESAVPDHYGYVIDERVRETVAALQLLGINTTQSDEGHNSRTPWIQFEAPEPKNVYDGEEELKRQLMEEQGVLPEEIDTTSPKFNHEKQVQISVGARRQLKGNGAIFTQEFETWRKQTSELVEKLQTLIREFYDTQLVDPNNPEIEIYIDFPYKTPEHADDIQDTPFLKVREKNDQIKTRSLSAEEYQQVLQRNQQEMTRFTEFLKQRFLTR